MTHAIIGIDHPIIAVRDLMSGRAAFERLGFTVTPRGTHLEWGTGNWCIMFDADYLELRGILDPDHTHDLGSFLQKHEGLMGIAFGTTDAQASYELLVERGITPRPVRQLTRNFELPEGVVKPRFALCFIDEMDTPGLMSVVLCQHLTPNLLRRPEWLRHANGSLGVVAIKGIIRDLDAATATLPRIFGPAAVQTQNDQIVIRVNATQTITLMTPAAYAAAFPTFDGLDASLAGQLRTVTLRVRDIDRTEGFFASQQLDYERRGDLIRIGPPDACGVVLDFIASHD